MTLDFVLAHLAEVNALVDSSGRSRFVAGLPRAESGDLALVPKLHRLCQRRACGPRIGGRSSRRSAVSAWTPAGNQPRIRQGDRRLAQSRTGVHSRSEFPVIGAPSHRFGGGTVRDSC